MCCAKADELDRWKKLAKANNRARDLIIFDESGTHRFNFLDYAMVTVGQGGFDTPGIPAHDGLVEGLALGADGRRVGFISVVRAFEEAGKRGR